jgi:hypothetical protein
MTEEALQEEQQAEESTPTLREALEQTRDELSGKEEVVEEAVEEEVTEGIEEVVEELEEEAEEGDEEVSLEAPKEWSEDEKTAFASIYESNPQEAKLISDRYTNMHKAFHERSQELSRARKENEGIDKLFNPRLNEMQRAGLSKEVVVEKLLGWDTYITESPLDAITALAKQNNIDLTELAFGGDEDDSFESEAIKKLEAKIQELEAKNSNDEESKATAEYQKNLQMVQEFTTKTDDNGNLAHPYYEEVAGEMLKHVQQGKTMEQAYEAAIWSNPDVRQKLLADTKKGESVEDKKARIAKAKRAGASVSNAKGKKSAVKPSESLTLRDSLKQNYAALSN